jgi:hypothetical protein
MDIDINGNLNAFLRRRSPDGRYASFDYCFNYFQRAHDSEQAQDLCLGLIGGTWAPWVAP